MIIRDLVESTLNEAENETDLIVGKKYHIFVREEAVIVEATLLHIKPAAFSVETITRTYRDPWWRKITETVEKKTCTHPISLIFSYEIDDQCLSCYGYQPKHIVEISPKDVLSQANDV